MYIQIDGFGDCCTDFCYSDIGGVLESRSFDTHADPSADLKLRRYLNAVNGT